MGGLGALCMCVCVCVCEIFAYYTCYISLQTYTDMILFTVFPYS